MRSAHYHIPIFIPNAACPNMCVFCDQSKISGAKTSLSSQEIKETIDIRLATIPEDSHIEIAFFGGNFTGLPKEEQLRYLRLAEPYVRDARVKGIRISTRPDYINDEIVELLKKYNVITVELGTQSMEDSVLKKSKRGHTSQDVITASGIIKGAGLMLGLQMMIGLPGDTFGSSIETARKIVKLGAECTRIYPAIVIKGTELEQLYNAGKYEPLSLKEAASWSADIVQIFERKGIDIIRVGLHPSDDLLSGESLVTGPFHISFRELVYTEIWNRSLKALIYGAAYDVLQIHVAPGELSYAIGYNSRNKRMLKTRFKNVIFKEDMELKGREFNVYHS